jgi:hypothetical protein
MNLYGYGWEDGTKSVVVAKSPEDAAFILDEIGEADPKRVVLLGPARGFFVTVDDQKLEEDDGDIELEACGEGFYEALNQIELPKTGSGG